jgi:DNA-binding response OmpR family regulator
LLVDDDPSLLDSLSRLLIRDGFHVRTARDGREGLEMARRTRPGIVVLDVMLPYLDGWEVLSALKADPDLAGIPVVMLTNLDEAEKGLSLGAVDYLNKPLDRGKLNQVLSRHLPPAPLAPVLVVEDDLDTREALVRILQADGLAAETAGEGLEALERMGREIPSAILLDLMMPKMDGFRFLTEKQGNPEWADVPLVVVTARELTEEDRRRLRESGVEATLQKGSYRRADLLEEVRRLVNRNHPGTPAGGGAA